MTDLLADCTTLGFGGPAAQLLTHAEPGAWDTITRTARRHQLPPLVIGGGSNLIAPDHGSGPSSPSPSACAALSAPLRSPTSP